jgi:hypothetical protein
VPRGTQESSPDCGVAATGVSPASLVLSNTFAFHLSRSCWSYNPAGIEIPTVWAAPGSLATTTGLSVDFSSSGY